MMDMKNTSQPFAQSLERDHSACGVGMIVTIDQYESHQLVADGLEVLANFEYRSGYNLVTEESDGSGIRFYGLPTDFFNKKIKDGEFIGEGLAELTLTKGQFAIGHYFLPTEPAQLQQAKSLIEASAKTQGLKVAGWRNLDGAVNKSFLSAKAAQKKPAIWQAVIIPDSPSTPLNPLEHSIIKMCLNLSHEARKQDLALNIVSQSSESIVYKGMLRPNQMAAFYLDLQDEDFTATAITLHSRFATNTDPQWPNAQPCVFFLAHNGELNSAPANAIEMSSELTAMGFKGIYPNQKLSDSMQFDADLANQMVMKGISLDEAFMRLMSPDADAYPEETKAMLKYWRLQRTPYNGPAFAVAGSDGYYFAKLDSMGLRPSRWAIIEDEKGRRRLVAASDDFLHAAEHKIIQKGHLEPGGMLMLTPQGELVHTETILARIAARYNQHSSDYFQQQVQRTLTTLPSTGANAPLTESTFIELFPSGSQLQRILYAAGWDYESEDQVVRFMAEHGYERTGAMGDDTSSLHSSGVPGHISYFFHQLFAQVSAPPLDSIKERDRFSLTTFLGKVVASATDIKQIELNSPILRVDELESIERHAEIKAQVIDISFAVPASELVATQDEVSKLVREAIQNMLIELAKAALDLNVSVIILSDRKADAHHALIPDLIALAAAKKFLENSNIDRRISIVSDSYQINGPHQASALLALGAKAVYPRGAYAKICELFPQNSNVYHKNYREALQRCLLKTMGKMGITDVNNYINGSLVAALGLDLSASEKSLAEYPTLGALFPRIYSPLKGINLGHIAQSILVRHHQANDPDNNFTLLPRSGYYMPEKNGMKHGFGPAVVNAFTEWMKEEDLRAKLYQMHLILERKGHPDFIPNLSAFSLEGGFLDPRQKDTSGFYPPTYLDKFSPSAAFRKFTAQVDRYRQENPTSLHDYFTIKPGAAINSKQPLQSQEEIRALLFAGSMSQGALTVASPQTPDKLGAHETLTRGMNAVGAKSASGEGGEAPQDLRVPIATTRSKQFASGRFGISVEQILNAEEIEIKVAQGAKPGEGGELPGSKVSIRFAAQRGGLPNLNFISPPPHHDIYSIEDLEQLIHDIKSVNPRAKVAVKLVASQGIGTIAVGVAKAGADVINIASHSGGTGAAQQSSIKHTGLPSELGLAEVDRALRKTKLRDLVQLRVSGGFKTAEEVLLAAILGADLFEFGTTAMLTLGCKMQRTCNLSCQPGVATDGHLFKGDQINTERYFVNLAALIQERLIELGYSSLSELRGRTDLLQLLNPESMSLYDFSALLDRSNLPAPLSEEELVKVQSQLQKGLERPKEDSLVATIQKLQKGHKETALHSEPIHLTTQDRSFGARIAGSVALHLQANPLSKVVINTTGNAGQSFAFVNSPGMVIKHTGTVQDGCAKSMTGGELILCTPEQGQTYQANQNTIAGNAMLYGASGGKIFVNGKAGHRFGILMKGAEVVVEGVGDLAFEYMTSGTGMILGKAGKGLGAGASGGIIFAYDPDQSLQTSSSLRVATEEERPAYAKAIQTMLKEHVERTNSQTARTILLDFNPSYFKVLIPTEMDKINSLREILDVLKTYQLRKAPLTQGMQVWLEQKALRALATDSQELANKNELRDLLHGDDCRLFSSAVRGKLLQLLRKEPTAEQFDIRLPALTATRSTENKLTFWQPPKKQNVVERRLAQIDGGLDELLLDALKHIQSYVAELSRDAQGCSGCRAQSCSGSETAVDIGCPSGKGINTINSLLKRIGPINAQGVLNKEQWKYLRQAFAVQTQESPFIAYTGAACPAPCQDACTETIPDSGVANLKRGGKLIGEHVHIKDIEYYLYQIGRAMGWFDGQKNWSATEIATVFGGNISNGVAAKQDYDTLMQSFKPPFRQPDKVKQKSKELIIIGSGPAAMQMAYKALLDGIRVRMYEKSDKPGGLLADGIPAHKFDKAYLAEDFARLHAMGLELYLKSEVIYDEQSREYRIKGDDKGKAIASSDNENQFIALCIGAGKPKELPPAILSNINAPERKKIIQAMDFLQAANDVAHKLKMNPSMTEEDKETLIQRHFANMDPRQKKIVVIGGGDTAQDVIRWIARYFNKDEHDSLGALNILVRGPQVTKRTVLDGYPSVSRAPTHENELKSEEVEYVQGTETYLVEPVSLKANAENGKLKLQLKQSKFKCAEQIQTNSELKELFEALPREMRAIESSVSREIDDVDLIICALGFQGNSSLPLLESIEKHQLKNVYLAGDAAGTGIIVAAQNNADKMYGQIRAAMGIAKTKPSSAHSFFAESTSIAVSTQSGKVVEIMSNSFF